MLVEEMMSSKDLMAMLAGESTLNGPFDKQPKKDVDLTALVKNDIRELCNALKIQIPQYTASRISKSDLYKEDELTAEYVWYPYVISYMARHASGCMGGTYLHCLRNKLSDVVLMPFYRMQPFMLRGIRLQVNSKKLKESDVLELAHRLEVLRGEPVALSFNNRVYDWDWIV